MSEQRYSVIFRGNTVEGSDLSAVKANMAKLFKMDAAKIEIMFSGKPVMIKKDLDKAKAKSYLDALKNAGAVVEIVASGADKPPSAAQTAPAPVAAAPVTAAAAAEPHEAANPPPPPVAPDYSVAEAGVTLVEHPTVAPANFDTTQFDLAEVGVDLTEAREVTPPDFDLSALSLDPVGIDLTEHKPPPPADFDTSAFKLTDNE